MRKPRKQEDLTLSPLSYGPKNKKSVQQNKKVQSKNNNLPKNYETIIITILHDTITNVDLIDQREASESNHFAKLAYRRDLLGFADFPGQQLKHKIPEQNEDLKTREQPPRNDKVLSLELLSH